MKQDASYFEVVARRLLDDQPDWDAINLLDDQAKFQEGIKIAQACMDDYYYMNGKTPTANSTSHFWRSHSWEARDVVLNHLISQSTDNASAWDSLSLIASDLLRAKECMSDELRKWLADVSSDLTKNEEDKKRPRPARRGRNKYVNTVRNEAIKVAAKRLISHGWQPTRHHEIDAERYFLCCIEGGSATDVVGIAHYELTGEKLKYKTVEGIICPVGRV